ncbi:MAG TPA: VacJ family lipoprotein [Rhizomicrobium sp.]|jgi:phospholipid-binding lipoprotein MlaA|nr:VacJ family lipoprotein [Rhizomicrobium sp.]
MRVLRVLTGALCLFLCACASAPGGAAADPGDPYEATNRQIFAFDQWLDRTFLARTARTYNAIVPEFGREGIHNLLANLDLPVTFANDVLQGEPSRAAQTLARFTVNATLGLGGLMDPATHQFDIPDHSEDFGQTLGVWGLGGDPYLVLPVLGPSSPRDVAGKLGDVAADPLTWIAYKQKIWWLGGRQYLKILDARARNMEAVSDLERSSVDIYAATRSLYRQYRASEIRNGRAGGEDLPEF